MTDLRIRVVPAIADIPAAHWDACANPQSELQVCAYNPFISHAFLAGSTGMTMLIYGTRRPGDTAWYPRSQKINWRGLGVIGRIESLDYDDGEPPE